MRKREALERLVVWQTLMPSMQMESLDNRLGAGVGAVKQRARILQLCKKQGDNK
jgi:hypothetical protein